MKPSTPLPLSGIRVLEFAHAVMGPACGLILADLGCDVTHIEPPDGDSTRLLKGSGIGYFPFYNRNKKSLAVDIKSDAGREIVMRLVETADVVIENFGPGTMERLGYDYASLSPRNPRLVYCSLKGFLSGPYEKRHAMDEVVQMMGGLAYMTGPPGQPLRAGTSVVDITGGMFGAIGILNALLERQQTGRGQNIRSALFETAAFMMGQHMACSVLTGKPVPPMPARSHAWSVYQIFKTADGESIFIGIISDRHWKRFCEVFALNDLLQDERLRGNNDRLEQRDWLLPRLEQTIARLPMAEIVRLCEQADIPFSPVARTEDLFDDPQLNHGAGLLLTTLRDGTQAKLPRLPLEFESHDLGLRRNPPAIGEDTAEILRGLGYSQERIASLLDQKVIACTPDPGRKSDVPMNRAGELP